MKNVELVKLEQPSLGEEAFVALNRHRPNQRLALHGRGAGSPQKSKNFVDHPPR